jgi:hypothetical protein
MSEKAKALVAETVDQLNKLPDSKKDKAKQMIAHPAAILPHKTKIMFITPFI